MDVRASDEAEAVLATGDDALLANGGGRGPVSAEWMIPKALWIARNEPEVFEKAETICEYQDFMTLRLTGEKAASLNNVSLRWHYSDQPAGHEDRDDAEDERQRRGGQRAEHGEQDEQDDREAGPLRGLQARLRDVLKPGPQRALPDEVQPDGRLRAVVERQGLAQVRRDVRKGQSN
ncbi:hypothetical protein R1Z03_24545 [Acidovorax sp. BLS4]|nr:hypothetical protein [Paracidovorax avenae]WOI45589.1 hypothetical protein R1Z03_24545 [Paracidovorax avenae]